MNADAMTDEQYRIYKFSNFFDLKNLPNDEFERSKRFEDSNIFNGSSVIASAFIFHFGASRALIEHFSNSPVRSCIIGGQEASDEVWCRWIIGDKRHCFHNGHAARSAPRPRSKVRPQQDCDAQWNGG